MASSSNSNSITQAVRNNEDDKLWSTATRGLSEHAEISEAGMDPEEEWYRALYEEDSKRLVELLEDNTDLQLWKRGWGRKASRLVTGRRGNYWGKEQGGSWMGRTALHVGARRGCVSLLKKILQLCENERDGIDSQWSLENLLLAKDGEYELDAIAMAMVNGNRDIVTLLLETSVKCDAVADKYGIRMKKSETSQEKEEETGRDTERLVKLKDITREVINRYRRGSHLQNSVVPIVGDGYEPLFEALVLNRYDLHKDFNFLPRDLYLFHFLFTGCEEAEASRLKEIGHGNVGKYSERDLVALVGRINELVLTEIAEEASRSSLPGMVEFLWVRQDGQGRPPLHVAAETERDVHFLRCKILALTRPGFPVTEEALKTTIRAHDGAGRTALHRVVGLGDRNEMLKIILTLGGGDHGDFRLADVLLTGRLAEVARKYPTRGFEDLRNGVVAEAFSECLEAREFDVESRSAWKSSEGIEYHIDLRHLSRCNGFNELLWSGCTPIHLAILHNNGDVVSQIIKATEEKRKPSYDQDVIIIQRWIRGDPIARKLSYQDLALIRGESTDAKKMMDHIKYAPITKKLGPKVVSMRGFGRRRNSRALSKITMDYFRNKKGKVEAQTLLLLMAASWGRHDLLKLLIDEKHDPLRRDCKGNTALHYAINKERAIETEELRSGIDLLVFVNCQQIRHWKYERQREAAQRSITKIGLVQKDFPERALVERQECINLLIHKGCNVFQRNSKGRIPYPSKYANPKFLSWWHKKQADEFARAREAQNNEANAMSLVAAFVATASYLGPFQPPGGFDNNGKMHIYDDANGKLRISTALFEYIFRNKMSFYFAIAAIILPLTASMWNTQRSMEHDLRLREALGTASLSLLIASIVCVERTYVSGFLVVNPLEQSWLNNFIGWGFWAVMAFIQLKKSIRF